MLLCRERSLTFQPGGQAQAPRASLGERCGRAHCAPHLHARKHEQRLGMPCLTRREVGCSRGGERVRKGWGLWTCRAAGLKVWGRHSCAGGCRLSEMHSCQSPVGVAGVGATGDTSARETGCFLQSGGPMQQLKHGTHQRAALPCPMTATLRVYAMSTALGAGHRVLGVRTCA